MQNIFILILSRAITHFMNLLQTSEMMDDLLLRPVVPRPVAPRVAECTITTAELGETEDISQPEIEHFEQVEGILQ